jgi:hypothetical protein
VFFCSEEHARRYRREKREVRGSYFTLPQAAYLTRIIQSAIFGFAKKN